MALETLSLEEVKLFDTGQYYVLEWLDPEEEDGRGVCGDSCHEEEQWASSGHPHRLSSRGGFGSGCRGRGFNGWPLKCYNGGGSAAGRRCGESNWGSTSNLGRGHGCGRACAPQRDGGRGAHHARLFGRRSLCSPFSRRAFGKGSCMVRKFGRPWREIGAIMVHTCANRGEHRGGQGEPKAKSSTSRWGYSYRRAKREGKEAYNGFSVSVTPGGVAGPTNQLQLVSQRQQSMEDRLAKQSNVASMLSQPLGGLASAANPADLVKEIPRPPRVKATAPLLPATLATAPVDVKELEEIRTDQTLGGDVAKAMLAQSAALTSLVAHLAAGQADPMQELQGGASSGTRRALGRVRLQAELASQKGLFFHAVVMQMARRMAPTSSADQPYGVLMSQGISGVKYLERFGGYGRQRELGVVMHQVMVAFDFLLTDNVEGAKDAVALLAVMLEQAALDQGRFDLAQLLTLQEDVPASIFTARNVSSLSRSRSFAPLADQKWVTCALAYLREPETISSKRSELASSSTSGGGDGQPKGGGLGKTGSPKKKGRGAGRGRNQDAEEEQQ